MFSSFMEESDRGGRARNSGIPDLVAQIIALEAILCYIHYARGDFFIKEILTV